MIHGTLMVCLRPIVIMKNSESEAQGKETLPSVAVDQKQESQRHDQAQETGEKATTSAPAPAPDQHPKQNLVDPASLAMRSARRCAMRRSLSNS